MWDMHRHLDAEEAERYLMGNSPEEETAGFEQHLILCASCRTRISNTDGYISAMSDAAGEIRGGAAARSVNNWRSSRILPIFGALACLLLLGILALWYHGPRSKVGGNPAHLPAGRELQLHPEGTGGTSLR